MNNQNDDPWININQKAEELTRETYDRWKDELDNLLIFASLFSAIVTSFTIEVASVIEGDSAAMTVLLLQTLIQQVHNISNPQPLSDFPLNLEPDQSVSPHVQRIYVLYSVSLTLSLIAVLGGIVCLQWLREFNRNITGLSHKADLSLQNQRHRSMRKWGVLALLNALPLLLLVSLALFFVGFFLAQWDANALAAGPVTVLVALAGLFIIITSFLPSLQVIWLAKYRAPKMTMEDPADSLPPPVLCPYRSPQAWLVHCMLRILFSTIRAFTNNKLLFDRLAPFRELNSWTDYDTWWTDKYETPKSIYPALKWIAMEFKQSKDVVKDAYRCFLSAITDTSCELLPELKVGRWVLIQRIRVPETAWTAFGFPTLNEFKMNFTTDSSLSVWDACLGAFSQIWEKMEMLQVDVDSKSDVYQLLQVSNEGDAQGLLMAINKALITNPGTNTISITNHCAVAATCYLIDQHSAAICPNTIPILINLCKRYTPDSDYPDLITTLCDKIRDKHVVVENHRNCSAVLRIFNGVFPSLESSVHKDKLRKMLIGGLLVKCPRCSLENFTINGFYEIIQYLIAQGLPIEEDSTLDEMFLYIVYLMERADWPTLMIPQIGKMLNVIVEAAEEYCVRSTSAITSTSTSTTSIMKLKNCVFHPSRFFIDRPRRITKDQSACELIEEFNNRLKALFEKYEESRGSRNLGVQGAGVVGKVKADVDVDEGEDKDGKGLVKLEVVEVRSEDGDGDGDGDLGIGTSGPGKVDDMGAEMSNTTLNKESKENTQEGTLGSNNDSDMIRELTGNEGQVIVGTSTLISPLIESPENNPESERLGPGDKNNGVI